MTMSAAAAAAAVACLYSVSVYHTMSISALNHSQMGMGIHAHILSYRSYIRILNQMNAKIELACYALRYTKEAP